MASGRALRLTSWSGGDSVWTLNQGDGTITRIDPSSNKVVATFWWPRTEGGKITFGDTHLWVTSVAIFLTDQQSRHTYPDGRSQEMTGKAGEVQYTEAWEHKPENISDRPFDLVLVELKG